MTPSGTPSHRMDLTGISVFVGMPTHRPLPPETVASLLKTQEACWIHGIPISLVIEKGSSIVTAARTKVAHSFLQGDCTRLFWIDSDMAWEASDFIKVLGLSSRMDIVGASYRMKSTQTKFMIGIPDEGVTEIRTNDLGCFKWTGMGLGFTCVSREVMEKLAEQAPKLSFPDIDGEAAHIFHDGVDAHGNFSGEDIQFFGDCRGLGYDVWIDPTITLGHIGDENYSGSLKEQLDKMAAAPSDTPAVAGAA